VGIKSIAAQIIVTDYRPTGKYSIDTIELPPSISLRNQARDVKWALWRSFQKTVGGISPENMRGLVRWKPLTYEMLMADWLTNGESYKQG